jgi:hypothetical protein
MFLNEEFLKLWEELSELNEAKADIERLVAFAGQELADKFLSLKSKLKAPENDLYYWIKKKTPEELEAFLAEVEGTKSKTQVKKDVADQGAELVCESEHWKVYHITSFEASQKYGRDTKWCITGINNWGDRYWNEYIENGIQFYFLITKGEYDPRGKYSKIAIAACEQTTGSYSCEVFNQQDTPMTIKDIPYLDEINIPGINLKDIEVRLSCFECGVALQEEDIFYGPHEECYCKECFDFIYYRCHKCHEFKYADIYFFEDEHGNKYCHDCASAKDFLSNVSDGFWYKFELDKPYKHFEGIITKLDKEAENKLATIVVDILDEAAKQTKVAVLSVLTGEVIFEAQGIDGKGYLEMLKAMKQYDS